MRDDMVNPSLFVLRLVIGVMFVAHGAQKLFGTFDGMGLEGTSKMIEGLGFATPYIIAVVWSCVEFMGGVFLILGILSRWAALMIALTVLVGIWKVSFVYGFFLQNGGFEYDMLVVGACVPIILMGGGSWSVWDI